LSDLVADARSQAQTIATATGQTVDTILGLTGATSAGTPVCSLAVKFAVGPQFAQTVPNAITITASRPPAAHPDQVQIAVIVYSGLDAGQAQVANALSQAGISGATLAGVSSSSIAFTSSTLTALQWRFTLTVPLAKVSDAAGQLNTATQSIPKNSSGLSLTYNIVGLQLSPSAEKAQACVPSDLINDAKNAAAQVAAAGGVHAGAIFSVGTGGPGAPVAVAADFVGGYTLPPAQLGLSSFLLGVAAATPITNCSATVQFQLVP
jgi:hypothetical protein